MLTSLQTICHLATCQHQACKDAGSCKGIEWRENHAYHHLHAQAAQLLQDAAEWGFVVTIEQQSKQPPAMGSYDHVVTVRRARGTP